MNRRRFLLGAALAPVAPVLLKRFGPPPAAQPAYSITLSPAGHITGFRLTRGQVVSSQVFRADTFALVSGSEGAGPGAVFKSGRLLLP